MLPTNSNQLQQSLGAWSQSAPPHGRDACNEGALGAKSAQWNAIRNWFAEAHHADAEKYISDLASDLMTDLDKLESFCKLRELADESYASRFSDGINADGIRVYGIEADPETGRLDVELSRETANALKPFCHDAGTDYAKLKRHFADRKMAEQLVREARESNANMLDLSVCPLITSLPDDLPETLEWLILADCKLLTALPDNLPESLSDLDLSNCRSLTSLPDTLPTSLECLTLSDCTSLAILPDSLPASLKELDLSNCGSLLAMPASLPAALEILLLFNCGMLTALPDNLPESLTELELARCGALVALPDNLPESLEELDLTGCASLASLPDTLPASLKELDLTDCASLASLPDTLPASLTRLTLIDCISLAALPDNLPAALPSLNLSGCLSITALPNNLPELLESLNLSRCISLTTLPDTLPGSLTELNLSGCRSLIALPDHLPESLLDLDLTGCTLLQEAAPRPALAFSSIQEFWYKHAERSEADIQRLNDAWEAIEQEDFYKPFESLLQRLSADALQVRAYDVAEVIEEVVGSPEIRKLIFDQTQSADQNCEDRPLTIFNTIQSLARFSKLQRAGAPETKILALAEGMLKTALLDEATALVMKKQWTEQRRSSNQRNDGPNMSETLEVQLELRRVLGEELKLPFRVLNSLYSQGIARLDPSDKLFAKQYVNDTMGNPDQKYQGLIATPMWRTHMQDACRTDIEKIDKKYEDMQDRLETDNEQGGLTEQQYIERYSQLARERQADIDHVMIEKTKSIDEAGRRRTLLLKEIETYSELRYA
jgi:hypothetical protein